MGKYNVGYHRPDSVRDLQGIATLTHDPIAVGNVKKTQCSDLAKNKR